MLSFINLLTYVLCASAFKKLNNIPTISYLKYDTPSWVYEKVYKHNAQLSNDLARGQYCSK